MVFLLFLSLSQKGGGYDWQSDRKLPFSLALSLYGCVSMYHCSVMCIGVSQHIGDS
jgi:hypothetical protein